MNREINRFCNSISSLDLRDTRYMQRLIEQLDRQINVERINLQENIDILTRAQFIELIANEQIQTSRRIMLIMYIKTLIITWLASNNANN